MRLLLRLSLAIAFFAESVRAQNVIDQQQLGFSGSLSGMTQWNAQSFKPAADNVSGLGLRVSSGESVGNSGTLTYQLWTGSPAMVGAQLLASQASQISFLPNESRFVDLFFAPVGVTPGASYWFAFRISSASDRWSADGTEDAYASGEAFSNASTLVSSSYFPQTGYDFAFRTYSTVPEPSTYVLVATALLPLALFAKRRRNA